MAKATLFKADGTVKNIVPVDGKAFTVRELQMYVEGTFDLVVTPSGKIIVCNDEASLRGLDVNYKATEAWKKEFPIEKYPVNNVQAVYGNVIISDAQFTQ